MQLDLREGEINQNCGAQRTQLCARLCGEGKYSIEGLQDLGRTLGSLEHVNSSPTAAAHLSLYTR